MNPAVTIPRKPKIESVPLQAGLRWRGGGDYRFEQKLDGVFHWHEIGGNLLAGEQMPDGMIYTFDVYRLGCREIWREPLRVRLGALDELTRKFGLLRPRTGSGGEFLEAILRDGFEGIVAKHLAAPWGIMQFKCKRLETFDCAVTEMDHARGSIRLALDGEDCGWCPARAAFNKISDGDVVEIAAYGRHASGKFREARFVRVRHDKTFEVML